MLKALLRSNLLNAKGPDLPLGRRDALIRVDLSAEGPRLMRETFGLIFDLGASEGNDTAYYLQKSFRVVAVEADPYTVPKLRERFAEAIAAGALKLLPFAASNTFGDVIDFHTHRDHQGTSGVSKNPGLDPTHYHAPQPVLTIDWPTLLAQGMPRYVKIDIEDSEIKFLDGMARNGIVPEFISVECHSMEPVEKLHELGYRRFYLVDQNGRTPDPNSGSGFRLPDRQREGRHVAKPNFQHASGPFGLDVFGDGQWLDLEGFREAWTAAQPSRGERSTWYDCHAWKPKPQSMWQRVSSRLPLRSKTLGELAT